MKKVYLFWGIVSSYFLIKFFDKVLDIKLLGSIQVFLESLPNYIKILLTILLVIIVILLYPYKKNNK